MLKHLFFLFVLLALFASAANAEGNVILTLRNLNTNNIVDNAVVYLDLNEEKLIRFVEPGGKLELNLDSGEYSLVLGVDKPSTPGKDYFKAEKINVNEGLEKDIYLFPTSSVSGIVKDIFDNVVGNARLRFECTGEISADFPDSTNDFGSFMAEYVPAGPCKIFANYGEAVGFAEINSAQGNITDVEIALDRTILAIPEPAYGIKGIAAALAIIVAALLLVRYKSRIKAMLKKRHAKIERHEAGQRKQPQKQEESTRARDIISTLNKNEKDVVEFILANSGEANQASIRHSLGIPRTSLSRVLISLEQKKIAHIKKAGKAVRVKLTDWFLGKG